MNKSLIAIVIIALVAIGGILAYVSYSNKFTTTKNLYEAQIAEDKLIHDEMWKIIKQQAGVAENYSESFNKNYTNIMDARYAEGGQLMKWIQESNPNFDSEMYKTLMVSIETYRTKFTGVQRKLVSIHNEMKNQLTLFPSSFFLVTIGGNTLPELEIVTSTRTEKVFEEGKDDDTDLFSKPDTAK